MAHALSRREASEQGFHTPTLSATGSRPRQQTQAPRFFWTPACRMDKAATVAQGRSSEEVPPKAPRLASTTGHHHKTSSPAFKLLQRTLNRVERSPVVLPGDGGETVSPRLGSGHPERLRGRLQVQSRHCVPGGGAGGRAPGLRPLPRPRAEPARGPRPPIPPASPPPPRRGWKRKLGALPGSADSDLGGGGARPRLPLASAANPAPGKFSQVPSSAGPGRLRGASSRRPARQPRRRRQPPAPGDALARSRGAGPAPGAKPQLTQGARKAEAAPLRPLRSAAAPTPRRVARGSLPRAPEGAVCAESARPRATETLRPPALRPLPPGPNARRWGSAPARHPRRPARRGAPGPFLVPPAQRRGRGAGGHAPHEYERTHAPAPRAG
ncbi:translation initiation factor IF-2-like [Cervus canadensis]|uniref:translation initiation factor IF-2-like n=1 Tax=Cervus canadensis TaxID=1574408 RepID=UPI001C9E7A5E|nr:translation initiation factor IF-2-like [Cervus canadensis]